MGRTDPSRATCLRRRIPSKVQPRPWNTGYEDSGEDPVPLGLPQVPRKGSEGLQLPQRLEPQAQGGQGSRG